MDFIKFFSRVLKIIKNEEFSFQFFEKRLNFDAFFRPSTLKTEIFFKKYSRVGYVCSAQRNRLIPFSIWVIGQENRPWPKGLKVFFFTSRA